jgi:hypothetical protein
MAKKKGKQRPPASSAAEGSELTRIVAGDQVAERDAGMEEEIAREGCESAGGDANHLEKTRASEKREDGSDGGQQDSGDQLDGADAIEETQIRHEMVIGPGSDGVSSSQQDIDTSQEEKAEMYENERAIVEEQSQASAQMQVFWSNRARV